MNDETSVAVIGMSGRFPGARGLDDYWRNLTAGSRALSELTERQLQDSGVPLEEYTHPDYVPVKGVLQDAERFEFDLFGFTPGEAAAMDPQHRLLLESAWSALEDAGYDPRRAPDHTGVFVSGSLSEHMVAAHTDPALAAALGPMQVRLLTDRDFLAPWISYKLDLTGPSLNIQTACAGSLSAVHLAVQSLLLGECDTALAGGVSVQSPRPRGYRYLAGGVGSPDGHCRPFDEEAGGTLSGEGLGLVVLRRLGDAQADGDPIRAVILGSALTNDGSRKLGFTAPSPDRQTAALREAWGNAGLHPSAAQYIEMHGTATALGDQVEAAAVAAALTEDHSTEDDSTDGTSAESSTAATGSGCAIGSVKSGIGHLDAAAGVAGLIKLVLMLQHRQLAPTIDVSRPHPALASGPVPLRVVTASEPWPAPASGPRLGGVTSVGIGGTNVHVVLAEAPAQAAAPTLPPVPELLPLSARTPEQLATAAKALAARLRAEDAPVLADVAHTLRTARTAFPVRGYVVASDPAEAADALDRLAGADPADAEGLSDREPTGLLDTLGQLWQQGGTVDWAAAATGPARRVHLPGYPFAGPDLGSLSLHRSPEPATATAEPPAAEPATADPMRAAVADILTSALGLSGEDDFDQSYFAVGGDSLTAVHLVGRFRTELGVEVPIELLLEPFPLGELVTRIAEATQSTGDDPLLALLDEIESEPSRP